MVRPAARLFRLFRPLTNPLRPAVRAVEFAPQRVRDVVAHALRVLPQAARRALHAVPEIDWVEEMGEVLNLPPAEYTAESV